MSLSANMSNPQTLPELLAAIQELIADLPTYGYRRVHALLRRQASGTNDPRPM